MAKPYAFSNPNRATAKMSVLFLQKVGDFDEHGIPFDGAAPFHDRCPDRAGVIDVDIDRVVAKRIEQNRRTHVLDQFDRGARRLEPLFQQSAQNILLGKGLGADDDRLPGKILARCGSGWRRAGSVR